MRKRGSCAFLMCIIMMLSLCLFLASCGDDDKAGGGGNDTTKNSSIDSSDPGSATSSGGTSYEAASYYFDEAAQNLEEAGGNSRVDSNSEIIIKANGSVISRTKTALMIKTDGTGIYLAASTTSDLEATKAEMTYCDGWIYIDMQDQKIRMEAGADEAIELFYGSDVTLSDEEVTFDKDALDTVDVVMINGKYTVSGDRSDGVFDDMIILMMDVIQSSLIESGLSGALLTLADYDIKFSFGTDGNYSEIEMNIEMNMQYSGAEFEIKASLSEKYSQIGEVPEITAPSDLSQYQIVSSGIQI